MIVIVPSCWRWRGWLPSEAAQPALCFDILRDDFALCWLSFRNDMGLGGKHGMTT